MNHVVVYSKGGCPFCSLLKNELKKRRISFIEHDLSDDDVRSLFYANTGTKSVPQLYVTSESTSLTEPSGEAFGGWSDVVKRWDSLDILAA